MGIEIPPARWSEFEPRLGIGLHRILRLLARANGHGTFFVLGAVTEKHPDLVSEIAAAGHELGSHGWSHAKVYDLSPARFEDEVARTDALLEQISGQKPVGFRSAYFSITERSLWALDVLKEHGYLYDASIYPGPNYRYGIPGSSSTVHRLENGLVEFPVSTFSLLNRRIGLGGAYLRILPLQVTDRAIRRRLSDGEPSALYLHPWEFDPRHPVTRFPFKAMATHYYGLSSTRRKVERLLERYPVIPMRDVLRDLGWLD